MYSSDTSKLLTLSLAHLVNDSNTIIVVSVLPLIVKDFDLSYGEAGIIANITLVSMIFLQVLFGHISSKVDMGKLLSLGLITIGIGGIATSYASSFVTLIIAQLLVGVGASFYHPIGYSLTRKVFSREKRGFTFGLVSASGDIGVFIAFVLNGFLSVFYGWRFPILVFSLLAILASFLVFKLIDVGKWSIKEDSASSRRLSLSKLLCILGAYFALVSVYRISYSYIPLILSEWLPSQTIINLTFSTFTLTGIIGSLASGVIIDKYSILSKYMIFMSLFMGFFPVIIGFSTNMMIVVLSLSIFGYMLYSHYPIIYGYILGESISYDFGTIYGLTVSVGVIGGFVVSVLIGIITDLYGVTMIMIASLIFSILLFLFYICWMLIMRRFNS